MVLRVLSAINIGMTLVISTMSVQNEIPTLNTHTECEKEVLDYIRPFIRRAEI